MRSSIFDFWIQVQYYTIVIVRNIQKKWRMFTQQENVLVVGKILEKGNQINIQIKYV